VQLSRAEAVAYMDDRSRRGFNTLLINLIEHKFSSQSPRSANREGVPPFRDPNDFTTTNDAYFDRAVEVVTLAQDRGFLVLLAPSYLGYKGEDEGWCQEMKRNGVERLRRYGAYVGGRFRDCPNLLWVEGGDYTPNTAGSPSEMDLVHAVAQGIREGDGGSHLHTAHWKPGTTSADVPGLSWLDIDATYAYLGLKTSAKTLRDGARDRGVRPFFLIESAYENEHKATPGQLRAEMWQPVLSGGTGFVFGNFPVWHFWNPGDPPWNLDDGGFRGGWKTALDTPGARSAMIAGNFFRSLDWTHLAPDRTHTIATGGYGDPDTELSALTAATPQGRLVLTYFTGRLTVRFDLSRLGGPARARWFDPSSGHVTEAAPGTLGNAGTREFTPPGPTSDGSPDWILILETE
jgi:hypothetical protein